MSNLDDLYVLILLALPDNEVLNLPEGISIEELARRFPKIYALCVETVQSQIAAEITNPTQVGLDSSGGT